MKVKKALILAGGKGTRFLPLTKSFPKEMLAIVDKPCLQLIVEECVAANITDILMVVSPSKESVKSYFTSDTDLYNELLTKGKIPEAEEIKKLNSLADIKFVSQIVANGSGPALALGKDWANGEPFAVLNGDDVMFNEGDSVTAQLVNAFESCNETVLGVQKVSSDVIGKYASCRIVKSSGKLHFIDEIIEKPHAEEVFSLLAPLGRYVCTSEIFDIIPITPAKRGGEVCFTDGLQIMANRHGVYAYEFDGKRYDFGDKMGYIKGFTEYVLRDPRFKDEYLNYLKELVKDR